MIWPTCICNWRNLLNSFGMVIIYWISSLIFSLCLGSYKLRLNRRPLLADITMIQAMKLRSGRLGKPLLDLFINNRMSKYIRQYETIHDSLIKITIQTKPKIFYIIQVYKPTTDVPEKDIHDVYNKIELI